MLKIDKNIPMPEAITTGKSLKKEFLLDICPKMEIGDSIFVERAISTGRIWVILANRIYKNNALELEFDYLPEKNGVRIWRVG